MSGTLATSAGLDARRRRVLFRSWHRGMREVDLILGRFVDVEIARLSETDLDDYEVLMEAQDRDIFSWLTGETVAPGEYDTPVFRKILAFHAQSAACGFERDAI